MRGQVHRAAEHLHVGCLNVITREFTDWQQLTTQMYVSSDIIALRIPARHAQVWGRDMRQGDGDRARIYRRFDLTYYAWLYRRMDEARRLHGQGEIPDATWQVARARFSVIWTFATQRWSSADIAQAIAHLPAAYVPPARAA